MRIHSVRFGHACNSSSTHTVMLLHPDIPLPADSKTVEFGWDFFTASGDDTKRFYAACVLQQAFRDIYGLAPDEASALAARHGYAMPDTWSYVDHQSMPVIPQPWPSGWDDSKVSLAFFDALAADLLDPRVVVLGGNDNTDERHPLIAAGDRRDWHRVIPRDTRSNAWWVRHDVTLEHDWWVLFNRRDGRKVRVTFGDNTMGSVSPAPELVDIKLTDACPFEADCGFCYQGSTRDGEHAKPSAVRSIISDLASLGVFEVAFGGGEPTLWPEFWDTLTSTAERGIVPNFTTKNLAWLRDPGKVRVYRQCGGTAAFSVNDLDSLTRTIAAISDADLGGNYRTNAALQLIPAVCGPTVAAAALESDFDGAVTFLGYKTTGRGNLFDAPHPDVAAWLPDLIKDRVTGWQPVGVDTVLARQIGDRMTELAPRWAYETVEGVRSCYIDAVAGTMHTSSYDGTTGVDIFDPQARHPDYPYGSRGGTDRLDTAWRNLPR